MHSRFSRTAIAAALLLTSMATIGCEHNLGSFTLVGTKNVNMAQFDTMSTAAGPSVTGEDKKFNGTASLEEAVDKAVEPTKAQVLTNARLTYGSFLFWQWAKATGNPARVN